MQQSIMEYLRQIGADAYRTARGIMVCIMEPAPRGGTVERWALVHTMQQARQCAGVLA